MIKKFKIYENFESDLTPETIDFTKWCLLKNIENKRYFFSRGRDSWYDDMAFKQLSWDEIYLIYKSEKYNL